MFNLVELSSEWKVKHLHTEMRIMKWYDHKNVMRAKNMFKTNHHAFIFMPMARSSVQEYLFTTKLPIAEPQAREWFCGLMEGIEYLHLHAVVHRDLKLDNFLLLEHNEPVVCDFSFAVQMKRRKPKHQDHHDTGATGQQEHEPSSSSSASISPGMMPVNEVILCETMCGTADYVAPEVHELKPGSKYDGKAVDVYAMGVSLFEMINLIRPFKGGPFTIKSPVLVDLQKRMVFNYNRTVRMPDKCKQLIVAMLDACPEKRPTASQVLAHPYLCDMVKR